MRNIALIIAGGVGSRMHQDIPKQFISIFDKPVIVYTLEAFEKNPNIDEIAVVCVDAVCNILVCTLHLYPPDEVDPCFLEHRDESDELQSFVVHTRRFPGENREFV